MKNICKFVGLVSALALGTAIASAANAADAMRVNVPFTFVVSGKVFPAGQYTVQETDTGVILVQGQGTAAVALSIPGVQAKADSLPGLHFRASNGQEYLVAVDSDAGSRAVPMHALETRTLTLSH